MFSYQISKGNFNTGRWNFRTAEEAYKAAEAHIAGYIDSEGYEVEVWEEPGFIEDRIEMRNGMLVHVAHVVDTLETEGA